MDRPNVLFILSDQHNAKCLSYTGLTDAQTPHLDRMAAEGVRFDNAITQNPICTPSRMCYLSGQYCHNHGYYGLSGPRPRGVPTIFDHFRQFGGYRTAAIGKIHCPEHWVEEGCDVFHETCKCSVGGRSQEYAEYLEARGLTDLEDHIAWNEFGKRGVQSCDGRPSRVSYRDGQEGWSVTRACEFMRESKAQGTPFLLHVSLPKPHQCYTPAQEFWDRYDEAQLRLPPNADHDDPNEAPHLRAAAQHWRRAEWPLLEPKTFEAARLRKLHGYLGNVSHVDHAVGELLAWLDANGLGEDTIVVYSTDHGDYACEHGIMEKAPGICHDAITRIPSLWRWPGRFRTGHVASELVETVDVSTTLCALCGLPPLLTSDGRDLSHLLRGEVGAVRDVAVTEFAWSKSLRKGNFRLVTYAREVFRDTHPDGFGQLYDLADDPWEMRNRYFDVAYRPIVEELRQDLLDWLLTTTRPATMLPAWPDQSENPQISFHYGNAVLADGKIPPEALLSAPYRNYL